MRSRTCTEEILRTSWNKFTNSYWFQRMSRLSLFPFLFFSFFFRFCFLGGFFLLIHAPRSLTLRKFRLIVCCAPGEQLLSQGHIPTAYPGPPTPFIPRHRHRRHQSAAAHPYVYVLHVQNMKAWRADLQVRDHYS